MDMAARFSHHKSQLNRNTHRNPYLNRSWRLHGPDKFEFRVLFICDPGTRLLFEERAIQVLKPKFNIRTISDGRLGFSDETRQKISDYHKGRPLSEEHKRAISIGQKGRVFSEQHRQNLSAAMKGKPHPHRWNGQGLKPGTPFSEEHKWKLSEALKRHHANRRARD